MKKHLKVFGLLALVLALGAGMAWAVLPDHVLSGESSTALAPADAAAGSFNTVTGNGTQVANVIGDPAFGQVLRLESAPGNLVTLAPTDRAGLLNQVFQEVAGFPVQVVVNQGNGMDGKVVIKGSNADNPTAAANMTSYTGGTVQLNGTLGVTNNNSLGQRWVGVVANRDMDKAPLFQVEGVDKVYLGVNDPSNAVTTQPFFLMYDPAMIGTFNPALNLTYVKVKADAVSTKLQGLWLMHGLDQRAYVAPVSGGTGGLTVPAAANDTFASTLNTSGVAGAGFVRLIKEGKGSIFVNGDTAALEALPLPVVVAGVSTPFQAVDGAHHKGGTVVDAGVLQVDGGNAKAAVDHFRGSLGKVWTTFQGVGSTPANPYNARQYAAAAIVGTPYNPLFVNNDAKVMVNRSQFFSDFSVAKDATFHVDEYTLAGTNYNPQVAVTLDRKDSKADGMLEGNFDLVVFSANPADRPANHAQNPAIADDGQAIFFVNNPENKIFDKGETLVANGVLEIAGAKSIGAGKVTVGAAGAADRGFSTADLATFAASKTFKLGNETVTKSNLAAFAAERGTVLSFKDVTVNGTLTINPAVVPGTANAMPKNWQGTVEFGAASSADAAYKVAGIMRNPTNVRIDRGVWQLNSFPVRTAAQVAANEDGFMNVTVGQGAVLSLGKDVNDFKPYMDVTVNNDSRIRLVLRDSDVAATRGEAMAKPAVFEARQMNYTAISYGEAARDFRLAIQLDPTQLTGKAIKKGWVKLVYSPDAVDWNALHFLRENSSVNYEDYAKVRITWTDKSDIVSNAVAHLDENSYTILVEVGADIVDPVNPTPGPTPEPTPELTAKVTAPADVKVGAMVEFVLGEWEHKGVKAEVEGVKWELDGKDVTADAKAGKLSVKADKEGTLKLVVTSKLKADPTVEGKATASVTVKKDGGVTPPAGSGGGGCDAGFAGLALLLAAPLFLRKKD